MNKLTDEQISDIWKKADKCRGDKRFLAYDVFNLINHAQHLAALLEEKDKALTSITEITWCKHNIPGPEQAIYKTAYKALTSSNNEGDK